ncbi:hypothetical protein [Nostoc sp. CALU 1950]|uniref:hypothetical protein n=1 Tax=Nostoc sp. CALU 1950 TaxID=3104321 RepID=UPI003EC122F9
MPAVFSKNRSSPKIGNTIKELLNTLTSDEHCSVMLEFEDVCPDKFAQLLVDALQWIEWMA